MASISHSLFSWQSLDESNDIFRFRKLLEALDYEALIRRLKAERKGRRNDYPIEAMWNSLLARFIPKTLTIPFERNWISIRIFC